MKKLSLLILCGLLSAAPAVNAENDINVYLNGSQLSFDQNPLIVNDRTYVPARSIFEAFGMNVEWDNEAQSAYIYNNDTEISLSVNSNEMYINGEAVALENTPFIENGRILVPLRAISEALDCKVSWDAVSCSVVIICGGTVSPTYAPTAAPTQNPDTLPTAQPTEIPSPDTTPIPTSEPAPTDTPTAAPTLTPTAAPTLTPTAAPTAAPTSTPTAAPTTAPTSTPTAAPTSTPTAVPTTAPTQAPSGLSAMEQEVLALVNSERAKNGLSALSWADDVAAVARAHSSDMINRGFFSHTNPDGESPFDRLKNNGISYRTAAENIAYGQKTPADVMSAWMNSSGHRANILNKNVTELGVGAVKNNNGTIYWTQVFVAR